MIRTHAHVGICYTSGEMRTPEIEPFKRTPRVERSSPVYVGCLREGIAS
jgi:hypothetical protein